MKASIIFVAAMTILSACNMKQDQTEPVAISDSTQHIESANVDSTLQTADTIVPKTGNDIRFEDWGEKEWLDNEYIRTLRKYLDDYNRGKVRNSDLYPYKEQIKSKFVVYSIQPYLAGGAFIQIVFLDMPDRVFSSWIYSNVDEERRIVESYECRSIRIEEETTGMTKEDILQAIKDMGGLKLW